MPKISIKLFKKTLSITLAFLIAILIIPNFDFKVKAANWIDSADTSWYVGHESDSSFSISIAQQLAGLASLVNAGNKFLGKTINLTADIVLNANAQDYATWGTTAPANAWTAIGCNHPYPMPFSGTFDGNGHTVSGIYIDGTNDYQGLFGLSDGTIKNVGVINSYIKGGGNTGGVVGQNNNGTVTNCYNEGTIIGTGNSIGGIAGWSNYSTVTNCYNTGAVSGVNMVGGVVGENERNIISNCYNTGTVSGTTNVGGIAGTSYGTNATVTNCYYFGCNAGIGGTGASQAGTTPFVKIANNPLGTGETTTITEQTTSAINTAWSSALGSDFAVAYSNNYSSSDTSKATVSGTTITGVANGTSTISGRTLTITQNELTSSGFTGATKTISVSISIPLTTVVKSNNTLAISCASKTYGGTPSPTVTTNTSGGAVSYEYKVSTALDSTYTTTVPTNVGSYTVRATSASTANYNSATATYNFAINRANNTFILHCPNIIYGATPDTTVSNSLSDGAVSYQYKLESAPISAFTSTKPTNAGIYRVRATFAQTANYNLSSGDGIFAINKATLTASTNNVSILAGDTIPTFAVTVTGFVYGEDEGLTGFVKPTVSYNIPDTTIVGDYPLTISGGNATSNYQFSYQTGAKLTIGVKVNAQAPSFNPNLSGETTYIKNDTATALNGTATVTDSGTVSYQWYKNTTNSTTGGTEISGATSATYTPPTNVVGAYYYYVVATNTNNSVNGTKTATTTSGIKKVYVNAVLTPEPKTIEIIQSPTSIKNPEKISVKPVGEAFTQSVEVRIKDDPTVKKAIEDALDDVIKKELTETTVFPLDINLYIKGTDTKVQPNEGTSVVITIPIPESLLANKDNIKVVCIINGKLTVLETKVVLIDGVYCVQFTATHFSPYAMVVDTVNALNNTTNPKTEVGSPFIPYALAVLISMITLEVIRKKCTFKLIKKG